MATAKSSPLRWQMSSSGAKKGRMSSVACGRLRHLQAVATWASAQVPPLGAFLGSYLASTSQLLGSPPPSSPHFTCQRCESILQVGINCSVRVRSRQRKKRHSASNEASPPVNCIFYYCQYCAFENMKIGTSKAHVRTKLSEMAARNKLSELNKGLEEKMTKGLGEKKTTKTSNQELVSATKVLSIEIAGSSGKKTKRKGWLSLRQLAASSAGLPSSGNRPDLMRSAISNLTPPRMNNLDSSKLMPKFSQVDFVDVAPVSSIEELCSSRVSSLKVNLELEQHNISAGDIGLENASDVANFHQDRETTTESSMFTTNAIRLNTLPYQQQRGLADLSGEVALNSGHYVENIHPIYNIHGQHSNVTKSPRKLVQSGVAMEVEKKEQLSSNWSEANTIVFDQLTAAPFDPREDKLTFAALGNSLDAGSQMTSSPTLSGQGAMAGKYMPSTLYSISTPESVSVPDKSEDGIEAWHLPLKNEQGVMMPSIVALDSCIVKPAELFSRLQHGINKLENTSSSEESLSQKRELDDYDMSQKFAKKQKRMTLSGYVNTRKGKSFVRTKDVQSKMKPLFWRMGRHWFTKCRSRTAKWRLI